MKLSKPTAIRRWCIALLVHSGCYHSRRYNCVAFSSPESFGRSRSCDVSPNQPHLPSPIPQLSSPFTCTRMRSDNSKRRRQSYSLKISTVDVEIPKNDSSQSSPARTNRERKKSDDSLISWKDVLPLSMYTAACLFGATLVSTYEDYDVTHVRPSPSTLRLPTNAVVISKSEDAPAGSSSNRMTFWGAATRGMGWGPSDRTTMSGSGSDNNNFFEHWYGTSAATLQWKPGYNEIMLQHRSERVPRWTQLEDLKRGESNAKSAAAAVVASKEQLQQAVLQLYNSLDELNELKGMADEYMWDEMKERLRPTPATMTAANALEGTTTHSLPMALEYSMDVLKSSNYAWGGGEDESLSQLIGFDWGSCAWRHCGAKADAQEAIAELYGDVGMLEPFECRFILDIVERSIRDVLTVVPDDLRPHENGVVVQVRPYEPYVPQAGNVDEEMGIDYEYEQALSEVRVDLSLE